MQNIINKIYKAFFLVLISFSSGIYADDYLLQSWKTPDGLPQDSILAMVQGSEGYLWLGTNAGLARFDGVKFKIFSHWNTPAMRSDKVTALLVDRNGTLWAGCDGGGVLRCEKSGWSSISTSEGLSHPGVTSLYQDTDGSVWIGTLNGLNRLRGENIEIFSIEQGLPANIIQALGLAPDGALLVGTLTNGLAKFSRDKFEIPEYLESCTHHSVTVIRADGRGTSWIGTDKGLFALRDGVLAKLDDQDHPITGLRSLLLSHSGKLWAGTDGNGFFSVTTFDLKVEPVVEQLQDHYIYSLLEDSEGGFWLGTFTDGLFRVNHKKLAVWPAQQESNERLINSVLLDANGFCWAGTRKGGLLKLKQGEVIQRFTTGGGFEGSDVRALFEESAGTVWAGTGSGVVNIIKNDRTISSFRPCRGSQPYSVNTIFRDSHKAIWIGTSRGIVGFNPGESLEAKDELVLPDQDIRFIEEDSKGELWIGSDYGLFYSRNLRFVQYENESGVLNTDVMSFFEDELAVKWVGTNGDGLLAIKDGTIHRFTKADGLRDHFIFSIEKDSFGRLWMSSNQGVFFVPYADLEEVIAGERKMVRCYSLDESDGMPSRQCSGGVGPSSGMSTSGRLLFPTVRGIAVFDPTQLAIDDTAPKVMVEEILADNRSVTDRDSLVIPANTSVIEFYFTAINFQSPRKAQFKYKLEGFDDDWTLLPSEQPRAAMYINLEAGSYRFRVLAANSDGVWNDEGASVEFKIGSGFPIIPILLLLATLAAGILFYRFRRKEPSNVPELKDKKYSTSALTEERALDIEKKLLDLMEKEQIYLAPDLTLKKLAERLYVHPNYLSQIINDSLQQRFSDFINHYRIEYAKNKLLDEGENQKTILDIAYESGFYSKSVFNTAFKKFTGSTPSDFRKK